jgi:hypothetical protein
MKMKVNWRKWTRAIHRDVGYVFFGLTAAYCISGLALNHTHDWDPNYSIVREERKLPAPAAGKRLTKDEVKDLLKQIPVEGAYKSHYYPSPGQLKVFFEGGSAEMEMSSGKLVVESLQRRFLLHTINRLHLNPGRWWTWFSDIFSVGLLLVAITGLFMLKGKYGITRRGGVLVVVGILVPTVLVLLYL